MCHRSAQQEGGVRQSYRQSVCSRRQAGRTDGPTATPFNIQHIHSTPMPESGLTRNFDPNLEVSFLVYLPLQTLCCWILFATLKSINGTPCSDNVRAEWKRGGSHMTVLCSLLSCALFLSFSCTTKQQSFGNESAKQPMLNDAPRMWVSKSLMQC
jgi:hypothetical protein